MSPLSAPRRFNWIRSTAWLLLLMVLCSNLVLLAAPARAAADETPTALSKQAFAPWFDDSIPWDGKWGALNSQQSERLSGACELNAKQLSILKKLMPALQADQEKIDKLQTSANGRKTAFINVVRNRLDSGKPIIGSLSGSNFSTDDQEKLQNDNNVRKDGQNLVLKEAQNVNLEGQNMSSVLPADFNSSQATWSNFPEFYAYLNSSPKFSGCDQVEGTFDAVIPKPDFFTFFRNPVQFFQELIAYPFASIASVLYVWTSPLALGLSMSTPHVERGDGLGDLGPIKAQTAVSYGVCQDAGGNVPEGGSVTPSEGNCIYGVASDSSAQCTASSQRNTDQLGFNCKNVIEAQSHKKVSNGPLKLGIELRNGLSAVYGIIVIVAALIFIFRRNPGSQYDIKQLMPRVFLAVFLSASAPFWIGGLISLSNWITQGVVAMGGSEKDLGGGGGSLPRQISATLMAVYRGGWDGGIADVANNNGVRLLLFMLLLVLMACACVALLVIAIGRWIALVVLVVMTPVACLAFVLKGPNGLFGYWARGLVAVCAIPVAMVLILVMGMSAARTFNEMPAWGSLFSLTAILVAFKLMLASVKHIRGWVTGNTTNLTRSLVGRGLTMAGHGAALAALGPGAGLLTAAGSGKLGGLVAKGAGAMGLSKLDENGNRVGLGGKELERWGTRMQQGAQGVGGLLKPRDTRRSYVPQGNGVFGKPGARQVNELPFESLLRDLAAEARRAAYLRNGFGGQALPTPGKGEEKDPSKKGGSPSGGNGGGDSNDGNRSNTPAPLGAQMSQERRDEMLRGDMLGDEGQARVEAAVFAALQRSSNSNRLAGALLNSMQQALDRSPNATAPHAGRLQELQRQGATPRAISDALEQLEGRGELPPSMQNFKDEWVQRHGGGSGDQGGQGGGGATPPRVTGIDPGRGGGGSPPPLNPRGSQDPPSFNPPDPDPVEA